MVRSETPSASRQTRNSRGQSLRRSSRLKGEVPETPIDEARHLRNSKRRTRVQVVVPALPRIRRPQPVGLGRIRASNTNQRGSPALLAPPPRHVGTKAQGYGMAEASQRIRELQEECAHLESQLACMRETKSLLTQHSLEDVASAKLKSLEEQFSCALCYEVMACPYILNPLSCGHSFCALCVLKSLFSRLHSACGTWHEYVECPLCRTPLFLCLGSSQSRAVFPFTPNRALDTVIENAVDLLEADVNGFTLSPSSPLMDWAGDGSAKTDWLDRRRNGREEMKFLTSSWARMKSVDFVSFKSRLGV
ncbi:hypothetical protein CONPUDRAFT_138470 [Coniophora puteana RWD-64-598 SS2]|uniref:RING-type domain-containing protein n=1 Tax=Coniophora puteana (strain RWD-64-598) TaxID=741705 RepID=A0A5M3MKI6_CONPW|nr:uncharacterized protein CONPUDRAFT_138470 [Coniophora puteana RWD-64-598 SS2]EIW79334.1 hypothetical protein CONPUDRAFT_138470 [Coniophora puteana RWD-64-598 SS2]